MPRKSIVRRGVTKEGEISSENTDVTGIIGLGGELQPAVNAMISRAAAGNPELQSTLQEILDYLGKMSLSLYGPPVLPGSFAPVSDEPIPLAPTGFTYQLTRENVILYWLPSSSNFTFYEIRKGTNWDTADKITVTTNLTLVLPPILVGNHTYLLRSVNGEGEYSTDTARVDITIPAIGGVVLTASVISNAITLAWTVPISTFRIEYYIIKRDNVKIAEQTGTFFAISEHTGGTYVYSVTSVDIAGNQSSPSSITLTPTGSTDYSLYSKLFWQKNGTVVNGKWHTGPAMPPRLYFNVATETYQAHFQTRSWASPQAQVNAGYIWWLSPSPTTGSYTETFDFGVAISNIIFHVNWSIDLIYGNVAVGLEAQYSTDNVNWSAIQNVQTFFASSARYVRVKLNFTSNDKSLCRITELSVSADTKKEQDGGESTSYASDVNGTAVLFNKVFLDVEAITVTPGRSTDPANEATFSIYVFNDVFKPTSFAVKIFDNSGVRITKGFRWNARGIV